MVTDRVKYIFVVGIGGSDLASKAVWNALTLHKMGIDKRIFFLESPDSREYEEVNSFVNTQLADIEETILIAVSKSGETVETLTAFHKTFDILSEKFGRPINERVLIVSTLDSSLWKLAETKGFEKTQWEGNIGGRFSAFTTPHIEILKIAGLNIERYLEGSKEGKKEKWQEKAKELAQKIFANYKNGAEILDFFFFNSELEDLGKWCRQLIAESLATLTPTVSIGPTDLHSMLELYLEKPKSRFTLFVKADKDINGGVNEKAYENVTKAFKDKGLPHERYEMPEINEFEIGKFMEIMMRTTIMLGGFLGDNPFDQPNVDEYKKHLADNK